MTHHQVLTAILTDEELTDQRESLQGTLFADWLAAGTNPLREQSIRFGRVVAVCSDGVQIDLKNKSDAFVPLKEWQDATGQLVLPKLGDQVPVYVISLENDEGQIVVSHVLAQRMIQWREFTSKFKEDDTVTGKVLRVIPAGLLVDVGITALLPNSLVDIRRPPSFDDYVGKQIDAFVLKLDHKQMGVILSRRHLLRNDDPMPNPQRFAQFAVGQIRKGVVKNVAEFGAFIDLGGVDGLLHIGDMSWGRVANVHDVVNYDQEIEAYLLRVDPSKATISLSLKHLTPSPWENILDKYPVGSRHTVEVIDLKKYGAFVRLEHGVEGLIHVSEMSWTTTPDDPADTLKVGDKVEVQVLLINVDKSEISLGMRQLTPCPAPETQS